MHAPVDPTISRSRFLRGSLKIMALASLPLPHIACSDSVPALKGLSDSQYRNVNFLARYFLKGTQFSDYDAGKALDDFLYARKGETIPIIELINDVIDAPSSWLASLVMDGSFSTMVQLEGDELEARMESWRTSSNELQAGAYRSFKNLVYISLSMDQEYQNLAGYPKEFHVVPYSKSSALFR